MEVQSRGIGPVPDRLDRAVATKVVATAFGGPEVLAVVDEAVPDPGPGQVSVEVRAVGTNPVDYKLFSGEFGADASQLPMPVGSEAAGVVTAVGSGATGPGGPVRPGDDVILYRITGAYASRGGGGGRCRGGQAGAVSPSRRPAVSC